MFYIANDCVRPVVPFLDLEERKGSKELLVVVVYPEKRFQNRHLADFSGTSDAGAHLQQRVLQLLQVEWMVTQLKIPRLKQIHHVDACQPGFS